jgi:taurine--2-oxoglutarate transaminase
VTGTNGILVPPDGYLQSVREVCDKYDILLILDEVMAGFGRTGKWFANQHWDVTPDIMCVAKGINSGYVPLGAMIASREISEWLDDNRFPGGLTYSGHPLACASAVATLEAMIDEDTVTHARRMGEHLHERLKGLASKHVSIGEIRGKGLFYGIELVRDRATREPLVPFNAQGPAAAVMQQLLREAWARGVHLASYSNIIRIAPPLIITTEEIDIGIETLDHVLSIADQNTVD